MTSRTDAEEDRGRGIEERLRKRTEESHLKDEYKGDKGDDFELPDG